MYNWCLSFLRSPFLKITDNISMEKYITPTELSIFKSKLEDTHGILGQVIVQAPRARCIMRAMQVYRPMIQNLSEKRVDRQAYVFEEKFDDCVNAIVNVCILSREVDRHEEVTAHLKQCLQILRLFYDKYVSMKSIQQLKPQCAA